MKYGFIIPHGDVHTIPELAEQVEVAGWDAVFIPDCISIETDQYAPTTGFDPWVVLAVIAARTRRVRLGTMLTPLSRRRPWKIARETVTLDHLSNGRLILPVGLGAAGDDAGFYKVGEAMDRKTRAKLLDESLEIITGLWSGQQFYYEGEHYHVRGMTLLPPPVQSPRIPIWVVGAWPRIKSMQRALRYDGLLPNKLNEDGSLAEITPDDIRAMKKYVEEHRTPDSLFDIVWEGRTPGEDRERAAAVVRQWEEAGATWWLEAMWESDVTMDDVRRRIEQGPPRGDR
jgi:luciferase-like monooxygenase